MSEKHGKSSKESLSYNKEEDALARHDEEHKKRGGGDKCDRRGTTRDTFVQPESETATQDSASGLTS